MTAVLLTFAAIAVIIALLWFIGAFTSKKEFTITCADCGMSKGDLLKVASIHTVDETPATFAVYRVLDASRVILRQPTPAQWLRNWLYHRRVKRRAKDG